MGIKSIHLVLIGLTLLLFIGFGMWSIAKDFVLMGYISITLAACVFVYGIKFLKKFKFL